VRTTTAGQLKARKVATYDFIKLGRPQRARSISIRSLSSDYLMMGCSSLPSPLLFR
jgi:hypothetical protein